MHHSWGPGQRFTPQLDLGPGTLPLRAHVCVLEMNSPDGTLRSHLGDRDARLCALELWSRLDPTRSREAPWPSCCSGVAPGRGPSLDPLCPETGKGGP